MNGSKWKFADVQMVIFLLSDSHTTQILKTTTGFNFSIYVFLRSRFDPPNEHENWIAKIETTHQEKDTESAI